MRLKDARELLYLAQTSDEKEDAIGQYYRAVRAQIADDVANTLDQLATELASHGPIVALTLTLAQERLRQVLEC